MRHNESSTQRQCVKWFRLAYPSYGRNLISIPNGGYRNPTTAAVMKAEGQMPGASDLLLLVANNRYHGLAIEMKTAKGRQSDSQVLWQNAIEVTGYRYVICRSFDDFRREICQYLHDI